MKLIFLFFIYFFQISQTQRTTPLGPCSFPFLYQSSLNYDCLYAAESNEEWCLIDSSISSSSLSSSVTKMKKASCVEEEDNNNFFLKTLQADFQTYFCLALINYKKDNLHMEDNNKNSEISNSQKKNIVNNDYFKMKNNDFSHQMGAFENHLADHKINNGEGKNELYSNEYQNIDHSDYNYNKDIKKLDDHNDERSFDNTYKDENYISLVPCVNDKLPIQNLVWKWDNDGEILKDKQTALCEKNNIISLCKRKPQKNKWMIDENGKMLNVNSGKCLNQVFVHNEKRINLVDCLDQV